jgi:hypothetical protein
MGVCWRGKCKVQVTWGGEPFHGMFFLILCISLKFIACSLIWSWTTDLAHTGCSPLNSSIFIMFEDNLCCVLFNFYVAVC